MTENRKKSHYFQLSEFQSTTVQVYSFLAPNRRGYMVDLRLKNKRKILLVSGENQVEFSFKKMKILIKYDMYF